MDTKKGSGDIISRATSDVENIRRLLGFTILSLCNIVLAYSLTIPSMFSINKTLTISALMIFPLILGIVSLFGGRMVSQRKKQQESLSKLSDLIQEDLSGISAIKIYAQEHAEKKEFNKYNNAYTNSAIKLARTQVPFPIASRYFFNIIIDFIRIRNFSTREWIYFNRWFSSINSLCRKTCISNSSFRFYIKYFSTRSS